MSQPNSTRIYASGKPIGKVRGETFFKNIHGSRHFLRKPLAIAFDVETLDAAECAGASRVQVIDQETGVMYSAAISHIRRAGFEFDRGYGRQIALVLHGWTVTKRGGGLQLALPWGMTT